MRRILAAISLLVFTTLHAHAQSENPAWLDDLTMQLAIEKECEVGFYVFVRESELGGALVYEARAQCVDGRQFDGSRSTPDIEFTINECGTSTC